MNDVIVVAIIGAISSIVVGLLSYLAVVNSNKKANSAMRKDMEIQQAVMLTRLEELTREVREHNNFARRMPVVESEIVHMHHDIEHLQSYHERRGD